MVNQAELEGQIVGTWLQNQYTQYIELFNADDFQYFKGTMEAIKGLYASKKSISIISAAGEYKTAELAKIMTQAITYTIEHNVEVMLEIVAERKFAEFMRKPLEGTAYEKATQVIEMMQNVVPKAKEESTQEHLLALIREIDERKSHKNTLEFGIRKLDKKTNGMHKGNLTIVAGRPATGKSALALQIANNLLVSKKKVLFISLEMSEKQVLERMIMHISNINSDNMKTGNLEKSEWEQTSMAVDKISEYKLNINTRVRNTDNIRLEIAKHQPEIVIVDQISLLRERGRFSNRAEEITSITRKLKLFAMDFNIPIIALNQINRAAEMKGLPTLADLKGSGSVEEDADEVIMLHEMTQKQCSDFSVNFNQDNGLKTILLMLEKNRSGEQTAFPCTFAGNKYKFYEMERK